MKFTSWCMNGPDSSSFGGTTLRLILHATLWEAKPQFPQPLPVHLHNCVWGAFFSFPVSLLTCASWDYLPNKLPAPKSLFQGLLCGEPN